METAINVAEIAEGQSHGYQSSAFKGKIPLIVTVILGLMACITFSVAMVFISPTIIFPSHIHIITSSAVNDYHMGSQNNSRQEHREKDMPQRDPANTSNHSYEAMGGRSYNICTTANCIISASNLIESVDDSVNPCDDFYQYACGRWMEKNPVPESTYVWSQFEVLDNQVNNALNTILSSPNVNDSKPTSQLKVFYKACMNFSQLETLGVSPLTDFLKQYGGWPMTQERWNGTAFTWQTLLGEAKRTMGRDYLLSIWVSADQRNTNTSAIYIDQGSLGLPHSVLINTEGYLSKVSAYKKYMASTASVIASSLNQTLEEDAIYEDVNAIFDFEMALANITMPEEKRRDSERLYNQMTISDLTNLTSATFVDWLKFLNTVFSEVSINIDNNTIVIVNEIEYIKELSLLINSTRSRTIANYIMWRLVKFLGDETNEAMRDVSFQYNKVFSGISTQIPHSLLCISKANKYMGEAVGVEYVKSYFPQQTKDDTSTITEDIQEAFKESLASNTWMDKETKLKAIEKADAIIKLIGYPDWFTNDMELESYYNELQELSEDNHFLNIKALRLWMTTLELSEYGLPTERNRWATAPAVVNAFYMSEFNSITLPAAILQPPFYQANSLQALNYGAIGQVIGHELTHAFDDEGRQFDKEGNIVSWWSNATLEAFMDRTQCIVNQYGNITIQGLDDLMPNATINGVITQGENIADNGGLRHAFLAYQKFVERNGEEPRLPGVAHFTPLQLFFLSAAKSWCSSITREGLANQILTDQHSPNRYRVMGAMQNMKQFSSVWNCSSTAPMNPPNKCIVW